MTVWAAAAGSVCSQTRTTVQPACSSRAVVSASRARFPAIFVAQKSRLLAGVLPVGASVPEAAVHEDRDLGRGEHHVRGAAQGGNRSYGDPVAQAGFVEEGAEAPFRFGVLALVGLHGRAGGGGAGPGAFGDLRGQEAGPRARRQPSRRFSARVARSTSPSRTVAVRPAARHRRVARTRAVCAGRSRTTLACAGLPSSVSTQRSAAPPAARSCSLEICVRVRPGRGFQERSCVFDCPLLEPIRSGTPSCSWYGGMAVRPRSRIAGAAR